MKPSFWISLAAIFCGLIVLLLPDNGKRVFSFNEDHGPSLLDLAGIAAIMAGWIYWIVVLFQQRARIYYHCKRIGMLIMAVMLIAGMVLIVAGLLKENNLLLYPGIALSVSAYLFPVWIAFRRY